ncbi:MAG: outer membrane beta-barrel protein [Saprospiraceae bacterium]
MENNYMDKLVRDSLGDYEMNFPASDWDEMEQRLDRSDSMRRKLYLTKGIEVCLMVFAIWTAVHWVQSDIKTTDVSTQQFVEEQLQQSKMPMITPILSTEEVTASDDEGNNSEIIIKEVIENEASYENMPIAQTEKRATSLETVKAALEEIPSILNNQSNDLPIESGLYTNKKSVLDKAATENVANNTNQAKVFAVNHSTFIPSIKAELLKNDLLEPKALELSVMPKNILGEDKSKGIKKDRKFRLGIIASMDWFNIRTPSAVAVTKESSALSVSGGFSFDIKVNKKLRLESGISASKRTHTEKSISMGFNSTPLGTNGQTFIGERIDLKTTALEIPLNAKYEFLKKKKTSAYVLAGISNHLIMSIQNTLFEKNITNQSNYDLTIQTAGRGSALESGLADQGEFNKNHFISLNVGLGIEHQLNDRLSIFAQGGYKHGVDGIGRHDDQISSVSVATGMRGAL